MPIHDTKPRPSGDRGASYCRVSDEDQDVTRQRTAISEWLKSQKLSVLHAFEDQGGRRHKSESRPGFQALLKAVEARQIDWIVIDHQDRLGFKGPFEWYSFLYTFQKNRVELWQAQDNKRLSDEDVATLITTGVGAHSSKDEMVKKASRDLGKKREMARSGEWTGGFIPYGCDVICIGADGKERWRVFVDGHWSRVKLTPDGKAERYDGKDNFPKDKKLGDRLFLRPSSITERLDVVRKIFTWFDEESVSMNGIAKRLNERGIRPVSTSSQWYGILVRGLLANPVYIGKPAYNKRSQSLYAEYFGTAISTSPPRNEQDPTRAKTGRRRQREEWLLPNEPIFPPIVDPDLWERVHKKLNAPVKARAPRNPSLFLSGLLYCQRCGKSMDGWSTKDKGKWALTYVCQTYRRHGLHNDFGCRLHRVAHADVLALINDYLEKTSESVKILQKIGMGEIEESALTSSVESAKAYWSVLRKIESVVVDMLMQTKAVKGVYQVGENSYTILNGRLHALPSSDSDSVPGEPDFLEVYRTLLSSRESSRLTRLQEAESEFEKHYNVLMTTASTLARERADKEMARLDAIIRSLREDPEPVGDDLVSLSERWVTSCKALEAARKADRGQEGRRWGEALRKVLERVVLSFDHRDCGSQKRSKLSGAEFLPWQNLPNEMVPEPGSLKQVLNLIYTRSDIARILR